jgi:hypothetical protein
LDVGIVCPQAAVHVANAQEGLGAAEAYTRTKCDRAQMAERCRVAGVVFQPMIFESFGGVSIEAERVTMIYLKSHALDLVQGVVRGCCAGRCAGRRRVLCKGVCA